MSDEITQRLLESADQHFAIGGRCYRCERRFPCQIVLAKRVIELESALARAEQALAVSRSDTEAALMTVGAFRQAIEDIFAKAVGESGEDGFIVSYVIPVGVLHRAIGKARGTDAGGKMLTKIRKLESLLARAYPFLTWRDEIRGVDPALDAEFDEVVTDVEVAIQHLPDDKEV